MGEWNNKQNPDCDDDVCAAPIEKIKIKQVYHPKNYGRQKRHDILMILLERAVIFTGKYNKLRMKIRSFIK